LEASQGRRTCSLRCVLTERNISAEQLQSAKDAALRDTITRFAATGSLIITDGEQIKPSFATYPLTGLSNLVADGVVIPFADGHSRQLPRLTARFAMVSMR
jgi:hypothetical protein